MKYGEIVQLGRHRLMCGDATSYEDIEALIDGVKVNLVLTDPPYGMKCQHKDGSIGGGRPSAFFSKPHPAQRFPQLIGDNSQDTARKHYDLIKHFTSRQIIWGGQYFAHFLPVSGGWIIWDKIRGASHFSACELAWSNVDGHTHKYTHLWNGVCRAGKLRYNPRPRIHPTQKPVELHMKILEDFSQPDDVILDCFGGSGTTLIASELTGRTCLMMEISPDYCDIIRRRFDELANSNSQA